MLTLTQRYESLQLHFIRPWLCGVSALISRSFATFSISNFIALIVLKTQSQISFQIQSAPTDFSVIYPTGMMENPESLSIEWGCCECQKRNYVFNRVSSKVIMICLFAVCWFNTDSILIFGLQNFSRSRKHGKILLPCLIFSSYIIWFLFGHCSHV